MLVSSYNSKTLNDVLIVMLAPSEDKDQTYERKGNVTAIFNKNTNDIIGFNFFQVSEKLTFDSDGPVVLSEEQVATLNDLIQEAGFDFSLEADPSPKFVVGFVQDCKDHADSDHLSVTQTEVDNGEFLQIVCGASNIAQGQKVVVAKPGAIMPDGMVIWPGELRGVESKGMICSAKELGIKSEQQKGILVLEDSAEVGQAFQV